MFVPTPSESVRTDDDCAQVVWRRGRKVFAMNLDCYGNPPSYWIGLQNPPGGRRLPITFEEAWKWFCDDSRQELT